MNLSALSTPSLASVLLASTNPDRLRAWYERAFGVTADADGFLRLDRIVRPPGRRGSGGLGLFGRARGIVLEFLRS